MTIKNYTFFSPTGTEFPVSANADAKLYMMLARMENFHFLRKDWEPPINTSLNRAYVNTSIVLGGRYFEIENESLALTASVKNYIHANIDLTQTLEPVTITVETANNSTTTDINNGTGVLKSCIEIVETDATSVIGVKAVSSIWDFNGDTDWNDTTLSGAFKGNAPQWKCYRGKEVRVIFSNLTNNNQLSGNTPYTIFNLPEGYRPLRAQEDVIILRVAGKWTLTRLLFNTNGTVQIIPANTIPVNTGFSGSGTISIE